jgi:hypothetical protein
MSENSTQKGILGEESRSSRPGFLKRHPLIAYFALTFVISWAIEIPLALSATGVIPFSVPLWLHYLGHLARSSQQSSPPSPHEVSRKLAGFLLAWRSGE